MGNISISLLSDKLCVENQGSTKTLGICST